MTDPQIVHSSSGFVAEITGNTGNTDTTAAVKSSNYDLSSELRHTEVDNFVNSVNPLSIDIFSNAHTSDIENSNAKTTDIENGNNIDHRMRMLFIFLELIMVATHYFDILTDIYAAYLFHKQGKRASAQFILGLLFLFLPIPAQIERVYTMHLENDERGSILYFYAGLACIGLYPLYETTVSFLPDFFLGFFPKWCCKGRELEPVVNKKLKMKLMKKDILKILGLAFQSIPQSILQLFSLLITFDYLNTRDIGFFLLSISFSYISITFGLMSTSWKAATQKKSEGSNLDYALEFTWMLSEISFRAVTVTVAFVILQKYAAVLFIAELFFRIIANIIVLLVTMPSEQNYVVMAVVYSFTCTFSDTINFMIVLDIWRTNGREGVKEDMDIMKITCFSSVFISTVTGIVVLLLMFFLDNKYTKSLQGDQLNVTLTIVICTAWGCRGIAMGLSWLKAKYFYHAVQVFIQ